MSQTALPMMSQMALQMIYSFRWYFLESWLFANVTFPSAVSREMEFFSGVSFFPCRSGFFFVFRFFLYIPLFSSFSLINRSSWYHISHIFLCIFVTSHFLPCARVCARAFLAALSVFFSFQNFNSFGFFLVVFGKYSLSFL